MRSFLGLLVMVFTFGPGLMLTASAADPDPCMIYKNLKARIQRQQVELANQKAAVELARTNLWSARYRHAGASIGVGLPVGLGASLGVLHMGKIIVKEGITNLRLVKAIAWGVGISVPVAIYTLTGAEVDEYRQLFDEESNTLDRIKTKLDEAKDKIDRILDSNNCPE